MTLRFDLTNTPQARGSATNTRSSRLPVRSTGQRSFDVGTFYADDDENDAAIIAAGIARIGKRPLLSLQKLDDFLAELDAEDASG